MSTVQQAAPETFAEAAAVLAGASAEGQAVRIRGGATKLGWGRPVADAAYELSTAGLREIVEHNAGDHTAVLQAGVPLATAQETFAQAGQRLALDPPLGAASRATMGGILATGDSGPLRHRFGPPRDLVLGMTVALSDGSISRSGGQVIKNVAGYDLAKLFTGSFGTLGLILSVNVRLHPLDRATTTAFGACTGPDRLTAAALGLSRARLEFEALDLAWHNGRGGILARCAGVEHARRGRRAAHMLEDLGLADVDATEDDQALWERQRSGQRSADGAVLRVAHTPRALPTVLRAVEAARGTLVGRAASGISYVELAPDAVAGLRDELGALRATLLDAPAQLRGDRDPWGSPDPAALALMRSIKARFDPAGTCNPGLFVGGI
ncbi:MAG: FAD-binding oxidoreductase [Actinomycetota bacterium]|nr:FAD-binding oxidoreductase [Actinomycetota bacterium]